MEKDEGLEQCLNALNSDVTLPHVQICLDCTDVVMDIAKEMWAYGKSGNKLPDTPPTRMFVVCRKLNEIVIAAASAGFLAGRAVGKRLQEPYIEETEGSGD